MLRITRLNKAIGDFKLKDINLDVGEGEYFVLLGPSGSGKSILFEIIAGLIKQDSGNIYFNGTEISTELPQRRKIGLIFQDGAVFPHLSVRENIAFPLKIKKMNKLDIKREVIRLAEEVRISDLLERMPSTLSGGELQRVAIARTLALYPRCLLLDEPISSLDVQLRDDLISLLRKINKIGMTMLHITHDYHEAFSLAGKVAIIDKGRIIQQGTPQQIYSAPSSKFVAEFIGIRNYYSYVKIEKKKIELEGTVIISVEEDIPDSGNVMISDNAFEIFSFDEHKTNDNNLIGFITEMIIMPNQVRVKIDTGIVIYKVYYDDEMKVGGLKTGDKVVIRLFPERFRFLRKGFQPL